MSSQTFARSHVLTFQRSNVPTFQRVNAFTLIELLAAMAILAIVMAIAFSVFNSTSRAWLLGENRAETYQNARLALEMIGRELEGAMVGTNPRTGKGITFIAKQDTTSAEVSGYGAPAAIKALNTTAGTARNDQIFFVGPGPANNSTPQIDLHEYGYFVVYAASDHATMKAKHYYLLRMDNSSTDAGFNIFTATNWYQTPVPSGTDFGNTVNVPILDNVLRFTLSYVSTNGNPVTTWTPTDVLPRAVLVSLTVLDRRMAERLAVLEPNGLSSGEHQYIPDNSGSLTKSAVAQLVRESARTFYKTVDLANSR